MPPGEIGTSVYWTEFFDTVLSNFSVRLRFLAHNSSALESVLPESGQSRTKYFFINPLKGIIAGHKMLNLPQL